LNLGVEIGFFFEKKGESRTVRVRGETSNRAGRGERATILLPIPTGNTDSTSQNRRRKRGGAREMRHEIKGQSILLIFAASFTRRKKEIKARDKQNGKRRRQNGKKE